MTDVPKTTTPADELQAMDAGAAFRLSVIRGVNEAVDRGVSRSRIITILRRVAVSMEDHSARNQRAKA